jgi:hypothetical protein
VGELANDVALGDDAHHLTARPDDDDGAYALGGKLVGNLQ